MGDVCGFSKPSFSRALRDANGSMTALYARRSSAQKRDWLTPILAAASSNNALHGKGRGVPADTEAACLSVGANFPSFVYGFAKSDRDNIADR